MSYGNNTTALCWINDGMIELASGANTYANSIFVALQPPVITTTALPAGMVDSAYSATLAATGGVPFEWSIESGNLPNGLSLDSSTGEISGTPTASGNFDFTVKAKNAGGEDTKMLSIVINSLGIAPITKYEIRVYPNPTTGELTVCGMRCEVGGIEVYDISGRNVSSNHLIITSSNHHINISHFPAGIYFLRIQTEQGVITKKIIKN
jgi:hypothetical protein